MTWVLGERWCVLMTMTVMMMDAMTNTMVKSMYFPIKGTALEVEGISSTMTSRNTVRDSSTEMLRVIFSPGQNGDEAHPPPCYGLNCCSSQISMLKP